MQGWRLRFQTRMMAFGALLAFPAVVQTLWRGIQHPREWHSAVVLVIMYLGIVGLALNKRIQVRIRGWFLLLLLYLVGVLAMARGGLWGDGRIYLVLLPVFGILLVDIGTGMILVAVSVLTFAVFGFLNHIGVLERWLIVQHGPMPTDIWLYDGLIFAALMLTAVLMMVDFYNLLVKTLSSEHETAENLREAHQLLDQANQRLEQKITQRTAELVEANQRLRQLVNHDPLTGLPNRILFYDRLAHAIAQAKRTQKKLAVLFIDLDNFKDINDTLGHTCGDILLTKVASRLGERMRESDTVARLSGDEFAIILGDLSGPGDALNGAERILDVLAQPFDLDTSAASLSASVGISIYPDDAKDPDELVHHADTAMYNVKHTTKSDFQFYSDPGSSLS
jgi:diguanylate cyclase (GGDEF)-like protein